MSHLSALFDFYLKSSTHVSLAVVAFSGITMLEFGIDPNRHLLIFIFFASVTGYNFVKYTAIARFHHFSLSGSLRAIQLYSLFCFLGLLWAAVRLPVPVLLAAAILGGFNMLYALPVFSGQSNLRSLTGAKIFVIALVWTGSTVWLPALDARLPLSAGLALASLQRFLFVMVLTLPFDIRDVRLDTAHLGTVPQLVGIKKTRNMGLLMLGLVLLLNVFRPAAGGIQTFVLIAVTLLTGWLIRTSVVSQNRYFAAFWVEGVPVLWWLMLTVL
ncbi:MAG: hypothetical protein WD266_02475 [Balneolales bacterium]